MRWAAPSVARDRLPEIAEHSRVSDAATINCACLFLSGGARVKGPCVEIIFILVCARFAVRFLSLKTQVSNTETVIQRAQECGSLLSIFSPVASFN